MGADPRLLCAIAIYAVGAIGMIYGAILDSQKIIDESRKRRERGMAEIGGRFDRDADRKDQEAKEETEEGW